jgi:hypothetical protein
MWADHSSRSSDWLVKNWLNKSGYLDSNTNKLIIIDTSSITKWLLKHDLKVKDSNIGLGSKDFWNWLVTLVRAAKSWARK